MNKKIIFSCVILFFGFKAFGQFNTIMSKRVEQSPKIVYPLYGPCLYDLPNKTDSVENVHIENTAIISPEVIIDSIPPIQFDEIEKPVGNTVKLDEDEMFACRQLVALPLDTIIVNSRFGNRIHPIEKILKLHRGIDLAADSNYVYSVMPGKIIRVSSNRRSGNYVVVEHGSYQSIYCHLRKSYVDKGDYVDAGQILGLSGNTGMSTGEHLHFALKHQGKYIDPEPFLNYVSALISFVNLKLSELSD